MRPINLGFSPCPNDTFIFHALVHGLVDCAGCDFHPRLDDVERLNQLALAGALDVTKVSYGVLPQLLGPYRLLRSGGALGRGCGPLVVARNQRVGERLSSARIAIPGHHTTANLLLRLFAPDAPPGIEMRYDRIMPAVADGEVDAGLIIHESRFTYPSHGLVRLVDLGTWWEETTGTPIPLGGIVARRELGDQAHEIERSISRSVEYAVAHPHASAAYVAASAQEMSPEVSRSHIALYVNEFSVDVGKAGERAVLELLRRAGEAGLLPEPAMDPFGTQASI